MKPIHIPDWWDSIRAIIALLLVATTCVAVFITTIPPEKLALLKELDVLALTFYFVLKKRPKENGGTQ